MTPLFYIPMLSRFAIFLIALGSLKTQEKLLPALVDKLLMWFFKNTLPFAKCCSGLVPVKLLPPAVPCPLPEKALCMHAFKPCGRG